MFISAKGATLKTQSTIIIQLTIKLTQYSHGAGCGCKISPKDLDEILSSDFKSAFDKNLLVGNDTKDDAGRL